MVEFELCKARVWNKSYITLENVGKPCKTYVIVPGDVVDLGAIEDACAKGLNVRQNCLVTPKTAMIFDTEKLV